MVANSPRDKTAIVGLHMTKFKQESLQPCQRHSPHPGPKRNTVLGLIFMCALGPALPDHHMTGDSSSSSSSPIRKHDSLSPPRARAFHLLQAGEQAPLTQRADVGRAELQPWHRLRPPEREKPPQRAQTVGGDD